MKLNSFYYAWGTSRAIMLTLVIILSLLACIKAYSYTLEMDYTGPGSEAERLDRAYRDRENERCFDRYYREKSETERDRKGAEAYERDHGA